MRKFVLAPDSFKGTMSSIEICSIMEAAIRRYQPDAEVASIPVADGGEGTVDCFLAATNGKRVIKTVKGPYLEPLSSFYGLLDGGKTAVVEMAAAAGLPLAEGRLNPSRTSTYGVGELIADSVGNGCRKIIVGMGGSCTNDGGAGMAAALGIRFYDATGQLFVPVGGTLKDVTDIDASGCLPGLSKCQVIAMCDVDNRLCGENGAAHVFAPQKGADARMVEELDEGLQHFAEVIKQKLGIDVRQLSGGGAAGGLGAGMVAFTGAVLQKGIDTVLDTVGFEEKIKDADLILTGEGKLDQQSLRGKVVIGVARRAKKLSKPVGAVVGDIGDNIGEVYEQGVSFVLSINRVAKDFNVVRSRSKDDLELTMDTLMRLLRL